MRATRATCSSVSRSSTGPSTTIRSPRGVDARRLALDDGVDAAHQVRQVAVHRDLVDQRRHARAELDDEIGGADRGPLDLDLVGDAEGDGDGHVRIGDRDGRGHAGGRDDEGLAELDVEPVRPFFLSEGALLEQSARREQSTRREHGARRDPGRDHGAHDREAEQQGLHRMFPRSLRGVGASVAACPNGNAACAGATGRPVGRRVGRRAGAASVGVARLPELVTCRPAPFPSTHRGPG